MDEENNNKKKKKKLIPLNDHAFKRMFGEKGQEIPLITIFNGLTGRTGENAVKKITIEEREIPREQYNDKQIQLDIHATTDKGERINIEAQLKNVDMKPRGAFYASKLLTQGVKKGQDYKVLEEIIMVTIFGTRSQIRDNYEDYYKYERVNEYTEKYEFVLPNFDLLEDKDLNNPQHRCLIFLSENTDEKMRKKVIEMEPGLTKAQKMLDHINSSPEEIELYEMRELVKMDIKNARENDIQEGIEIGEEKGRKIGEEKGRKKEKIEIAKKLKNEGVPLKIIAETTEIPLSKVKKL